MLLPVATCGILMHKIIKVCIMFTVRMLLRQKIAGCQGTSQRVWSFHFMKNSGNRQSVQQCECT